MKFYLKIFIFIIIVSEIKAQFNPGAKEIAIANSDVALSNNVFCLFNNPSGLSQFDWREAGIFYSPSPFGLKELASGYFAYNEPTVLGNFAIGCMTYGFELYRETKIAIAYSYNFNNLIFAGTSINFHNLSIKNYGSDFAFYFNLGGLIYLSNNLRFGFSLLNTNRASFGNEENQIPVIYSSGFSVDATKDVSINLSLQKELGFNPSVNLGINYDIIKYISLRSGISTYPRLFSAGIGINYSSFQLDYALINHNELGLTHQIGLVISFGKNESRTDDIKEFLNKK